MLHFESGHLSSTIFRGHEGAFTYYVKRQNEGEYRGKFHDCHGSRREQMERDAVLKFTESAFIAQQTRRTFLAVFFPFAGFFFAIAKDYGVAGSDS